MDIHEHQAKDLLSGFGVPIPEGIVAYTADQAVQAAEEIGGGRWAVKAQIHSGARGKAGGIRLCSTCLLYTSPSPRDKRQSRMPSSA